MACTLHRGRPAQTDHLSGTIPEACGPIAAGLAQPAGLAMILALLLIYPAAFVLPWRWLSAIMARSPAPRPWRSLALLALVLTALWDPTGYVVWRLD